MSTGLDFTSNCMFSCLQVLGQLFLGLQALNFPAFGKLIELLNLTFFRTFENL